MYSEGQNYAKVGIVTVDIHGSSYRLRFTYPKGNRNQFKVAKISDEGWETAIRAARLINRDIDLGDFDDTLARYSPERAVQLKIAKEQASKEYTLLELWERYKEIKNKSISEATKNNLWIDVDRCLNKVDSKLLLLGKAKDFILKLQTTAACRLVKYSSSNEQTNYGHL